MAPASLLLFASLLTLSGRVVDRSGQPLAGVAVNLQRQGLSDVSDAQGRFDFPGSALRGAPPAAFAVRARGSRLRFSGLGKFQARMLRSDGSVGAAFQGQGTAVWDLSGSARLADGPYLLEVRSLETGGLDVWACGVAGGKASVAPLPHGPSGLEKRAAAAEDTLALAKNAYLARRFALKGSEGDLGDLVLYPIFPGTPGKFEGFDQYSLTVAGKSCLVVAPKKPRPGNPWIWKTYFRTHKPYIDSILLARGYYHAFIDLPNMYGAPSAVALMDQFHAHMTSQYGLSAKPVLLGISRGGLYAYNWARSNLGKVSAIYADGPVMDMVSWPCGCYGTGGGSSGSWSELKQVYGFSGDAQAKAYAQNPYQSMKVFAEAKVPLIHVYGEEDKLVPAGENTLRANDSLKAHGWQMKLLAKPGTDHVHGLQPADGGRPGQLDTLINFVLRNTD